MNQVILIGRLTRDPELEYTPNTQAAVCRFTIAVDRPKRSGDAQGDGDYVRSADFIRITVWGRQGETCDRYLSKGRQVAVQGHIATGSHKNREGVTVYTTDVVADRVEFLGSGNSQQTQPRESAEQIEKKASDMLLNQSVQQTSFDDLPDTFQAAEDDIPF